MERRSILRMVVGAAYRGLGDVRTAAAMPAVRNRRFDESHRRAHPETVNHPWDRLADSIFHMRLPFLDVMVGLVAELEAQPVRHVPLTHNHFDHVLGSPVFKGAQFYCAPPVADKATGSKEHLRADALRHGLDTVDVDAGSAAAQGAAAAIVTNFNTSV